MQYFLPRCVCLFVRSSLQKKTTIARVWQLWYSLHWGPRYLPKTENFPPKKFLSHKLLDFPQNYWGEGCLLKDLRPVAPFLAHAPLLPVGPFVLLFVSHFPFLLPSHFHFPFPFLSHFHFLVLFLPDFHFPFLFLSCFHFPFLPARPSWLPRAHRRGSDIGRWRFEPPWTETWLFLKIRKWLQFLEFFVDENV